MPIPSSGSIKFSDLQNEFGGANPVSAGEYYRDPQRSTTFLLVNDQTQAGQTRPHSATSNQTIPSSGALALSNFRGGRQYQRFTYSVDDFIAGPIGAGSSTPSEVLFSSQQISGFTWDPAWDPNRTRIWSFNIRIRGSRDPDPQKFGGDDDGTWIYDPRIVVRTNDNTVIYNQTIGISSANYSYVNGSAAEELLVLTQGTSYFADFYATIRYIPGGSRGGGGAIFELSTPLRIDVGLD